MSAFTTIASLPAKHVVPWVVLYIGPDAFLPLTSALVAIAGFLMMFWHRAVGFIHRILDRGSKQAAQPPLSKSGKHD